MKREEMKANLMRYRDAIVRERQMAGELRQLRIRRRMLEQCQGAEAADAAKALKAGTGDSAECRGEPAHARRSAGADWADTRPE